MNKLAFYTIIIASLLACIPMAAHTVPDSTAVDTTQAHNAPSSRRFITPVKENTNKVLLPSSNIDEKQLELYLTGDTAKALAEAARDSIKRAYTRYPKLTDMAVGLNFLDLIMGVAGQDYMNIDASFSLNMWNRIQPVAELGVGFAKSTPDEGNYTYRGKIAPFARIGANYNFTFKNSPDYQALVGLRLGGSMFKWDITNIQHHNGYWGETTTTEILNQSGRALWWEAVAGLKVKIWQRISLGWMVRYHSILSENKHTQGNPWFIPGYGKRSGSIGLGFSIYYTIPFPTKTAEQPTPTTQE